MTGSAELLTLDDAARLVPGADAETLKRLARKGKLVVYRPGKKFLTTAADVQRMIEACRVAPKAPACGSGRPAVTAPEASPMTPPGSSSTELSSAALDLALARLPQTKNRR